MKLFVSNAAMVRLMFSEQHVHAAVKAGQKKLKKWRDCNIVFIMICLKDIKSANRLLPDLELSNLYVLVLRNTFHLAFERILGENPIFDLDQDIENC